MSLSGEDASRSLAKIPMEYAFGWAIVCSSTSRDDSKPEVIAFDIERYNHVNCSDEEWEALLKGLGHRTTVDSITIEEIED